MTVNAAVSTPYDRRTILFHWLTAALFAEQWLGAHAIDWFPRGLPRTDARSVHLVLGLALLVIVIVRLIWRWTRGLRLPPADRGPLHVAAILVHGGLYALLLTTLGLGLVNMLARGDSLFGVVDLPRLAQDRTLRGEIQEWHELSANLLLALAGLHIMAGLWHQFIRRDGLWGRMIPALARNGV